MAKLDQVKEQQLSFEEALERLEELTAALEQGNLSLEATLTAFKEGKSCSSIAKGCWERAEETLKVMDFNSLSPGPESDWEEEE